MRSILDVPSPGDAYEKEYRNLLEESLKDIEEFGNFLQVYAKAHRAMSVTSLR